MGLTDEQERELRKSIAANRKEINSILDNVQKDNASNNLKAVGVVFLYTAVIMFFGIEIGIRKNDKLKPLNQLEIRKPIKPILKITTDGVKSDTVYIYQKP